ncbi:hypothetical protein [Salmonella enterica]|uniref:Acetyltransferase n=1 Tax=Salmonella enterica TaxID=28901 RepID=A0A379QPF7_SALER|nr:acetyltransferase [Salmonella enterica]
MSSTQLPSTLRRISADDNTSIANVIRQVSAEHGLTADKATWWPAPIRMNWVVEQNGQVVGGGVALLVL